MGKEEVLILAIESSCDETAAAVVKMAGRFYQMLFRLRLICTNFTEELCLRSHPESTLKKSIR